MCQITAIKLNGPLSIILAEPFEIPSTDIAEQVDKIWQSEKMQRGDQLTNGDIYSLVEHRPGQLVLQPAQYSHVLALRRAPALYDAGLSIRPLAVTGLLLCKGGLVLGRRGAGVASDSCLWEPAPAGGLNRPDADAVLLEELHEELGLAPDQVEAPELCALVEDQRSRVLDMVFRLRCTLSSEEIRSAWQSAGSNEYAELAIVPPENLPRFLDTNKQRLLPALIPMLKAACLLHENNHSPS